MGTDARRGGGGARAGLWGPWDAGAPRADPGPGAGVTGGPGRGPDGRPRARRGLGKARFPAPGRRGSAWPSNATRPGSSASLWDSQAPIPSQSRPPSRRRVPRGEPIDEALFRRAQAQFRPERWNAEPDWNEVWLYTSEQGSALVTPLSTSGPSHRFLTAPVRGEEILALYVAEIQWEESASMTGRIWLYHPDGGIILTANLPKGEGKASRPAQNRPPGHPRPSQAICCRQPEIWVCIAERLGLCRLCCCYTPASCAACAAGIAAFCAALFCYFC